MADTELAVPQAAKEAAEPDADKEVKVVLMRHVGGEFASWQPQPGSASYAWLRRCDSARAECEPASLGVKSSLVPSVTTNHTVAGNTCSLGVSSRSLSLSLSIKPSRPTTVRDNPAEELCNG
eukprot:235902-Rhodomonas_salina.1